MNVQVHVYASHCTLPYNAHVHVPSVHV